MPNNYDRNDLYWSMEGDLAVDSAGDIKSTKYDTLLSLKQQVMTRIRYDKSQWQWQAELGANLSMFVGEPNTAVVGEALKQAVINSLLQHGLVAINDIHVKVAPLSPTDLAFQVAISVMPTKANLNSTYTTVNFLYDYADNNVYPIREAYKE